MFFAKLMIHRSHSYSLCKDKGFMRATFCFLGYHESLVSPLKRHFQASIEGNPPYASFGTFWRQEIKLPLILMSFLLNRLQNLFYLLLVAGTKMFIKNGSSPLVSFLNWLGSLLRMVL